MDHANFRRLIESGKFVETQTEQTIPLPNGSPGFYLMRTRYAPDIDARLARERAAREQLERTVSAETWWWPLPLQFTAVQNLFTTIRHLRANPRHQPAVMISRCRTKAHDWLACSAGAPISIC
jgi:hypothetical protein